MKAERLAKLLDEAAWDEHLFLQVPRETLELPIRYILHADVDKQAFDRKVHDVTHPQIRSTAMTLAQQLRQEGRQEGRQEAILDNLRLRFGMIPEGLAETVHAIFDDDHLRRLHRASLEAASVENFAAVL